MVAATARVDTTSPATILHTAFPLGHPLLYTVITGHVTYQCPVKISDKILISHPEIQNVQLNGLPASCTNYCTYTEINRFLSQFFLLISCKL